MPTTYLPNGHTLAQGLVLDEAFVKIIARQSDGTYKWVHGANDPPTAIESVVWDTNGGITLTSLNVASASLQLNGQTVLDVAGGTVRFGGAFATASVPVSTVTVGGTPGTRAKVELKGTFNTGAGTGLAVLRLTTSLVSTTAQNLYGIEVNPAFTEFTSGTHPTIAGVRTTFLVTDGAATTTDVVGVLVEDIAAATGTTNASAIKVTAAPTGGANNYALWIVAGNVKLPLGGGTGIVDVGAADSGGAGFRLLRVPN